MRKLIILLIISSFILVSCSSSTTKDNSPPETTPTTDSPTTTNNELDISNLPVGVIIKDGTYVVGEDLPVGEYYVGTNSENTPGKYIIITNGVAGSTKEAGINTIISLNNEQSIKLDGSFLVIKSIAEQQASATIYSSGTYLAGTDVPTGNYIIINTKETGTSGYKVTNDKEGIDVVESGSIKGRDKEVINAEVGQYITLNGSSMANLDNRYLQLAQ